MQEVKSNSKYLLKHHTHFSPQSTLMSVFEYIIFLILFMYFLLYFILNIGNKSYDLTHWPVIGMTPTIVNHLHRAHDKITQVLSECGGTYLLMGPWFLNRDLLFTCDPANIQHIFSKKFSNYPKGFEFRSKFEILGDGIFVADFGMWELQRKTTLSLMSQANVFSNDSLERIGRRKIENGLLQVLDHFCERRTDFDLQEVFQRFAFDNICQIVLGHDPCSLAIDFPYIPCEKAFSTALQPLMHRFILPDSIWKLQKWLKIGNEKKLLEAWKAFDDFLYPFIKNGGKNNMNIIISAFEKAYQESDVKFSGDLTQFLRDSLLGLLFAGRDTTSTSLTWFFWLIAKNPSAESEILEEIVRELDVKEEECKNRRVFTAEESNKLRYLHGALCETLRLYPPLALEYKSPVRSDTLPSGHFVAPNSKIVISFYSVGRMEALWGKDCLEFKPERWISLRGGIKHEPSYKFPAFNVGPRTCLGKEMSFAQMKMVAATIVYHYRVEPVEGHPVAPRDSLMLHVKDGLRVKLTKRNV